MRESERMLFENHYNCLTPVEEEDEVCIEQETTTPDISQKSDEKEESGCSGEGGCDEEESATPSHASQESDGENEVNDDDFVESEAVQKAKLHSENIQDLEAQWLRHYVKYGSYFGESKEQSDYFAMLPLNDSVRETVLKRALELERIKQSTVSVK